MPLQDPRVQSALAELQRRGVIPSDEAPAPMINPGPSSAPVSAADISAPAPSAPTLPEPAPPAPAQIPAPDYSSPRDVERQLKLKQMKGDLAIQDSVNELKRRGVNLQLKTQPAAEELATRAATGAVENARAEGDPDAFKAAYRQLFPGKALPRKNGQIDYQTGQEDLDIELDRRKKLEAAKVGAHNIVETKVKRINPTTKKEEEVLVRTDKMTGQSLGETVLNTQNPTLNEQEAGAARYSSRMNFNQKILTDTESAGFDPTAIGTTVQKFLPNRFQSDQMQTYKAAKQNWIAAVLRKESGAAIAKKEYTDADAQYFPQDGDSKAVVKQKQALRELAEEEMTKSIGPSAPDRTHPHAPGVNTPTPPSSTPAPVSVNSAAEAPPTAKFIRSPSGRVYLNPKYTGQ